MEKRLITARELAEYLGSSVGGVYQRVARREIPYVKIGGSLRFDLAEIEKWILAHSQKSSNGEKLDRRSHGKK